MVWWSDPAVMDLCLGETWDGAGLPSHGQPQAKYVALNRCSWGRKNDPPLDQEKSQSAFIPEAQSILPFRYCLSILPIQPALPAAKGLKSGKESFINKLIAILKVKGGRGRGSEGQRLVPRKGSSSLYSGWENRKLFWFFKNVKYFGGESEIF